MQHRLVKRSIGLSEASMGSSFYYGGSQIDKLQTVTEQNPKILDKNCQTAPSNYPLHGIYSIISPLDIHAKQVHVEGSQQRRSSMRWAHSRSNTWSMPQR
jgi:hypothetical protein